MSQKERKSQTQTALDELRPKPETEEKNPNKSEYKPKDSLFVKEKRFIDRKTQQEKFVEADWINININGKQMTLYKGKHLTDKEAQNFDDAAKKYYLTK